MISNRFLITFPVIANREIIKMVRARVPHVNYKVEPPKIPAWAQEALMKYCSKKPAS
jgi:hypothetical protein